MFLRDTNGDDRADERRVILHGFGTEDSHHAIHAFQWGPGGDLYFQEGTFLHSQVETPYGPVRVENAAVFRYRAEDRAAGGVRLVSLRQPLGPRRRLLGPALHLGCLGRRQLLRHAVFRARRLPAQAAPDEGVDADEGAADGQHRVHPEPSLPGRGAGPLRHQQRHRVPRHQAVPRRRGRVGLHGHRGRAAAAVHGPELPPGGDADGARRRALHRRLVQPAHRPHAGTRCATRVATCSTAASGA